MEISAEASPRLRRDSLRNKQRLLNATGELLRSDPANASMSAIAKQAKLSVATAYRYFQSLDDLHNEYLYSVLVNLEDYSFDSILHGKALFKDVVMKWLDLLDVYGSAMVQVRSRRGFLSRLSQGDKLVRKIHDIWTRPVREILRELGVSEKHFEHALFLYNIIFDPREILDLKESTGWSNDKIMEQLTAAYYGAIQAWGQQAN